MCVAANTKLLQVKVQKALRVLYAEHEFSLPHGKKLDDMVDKCDTTLRILLSMIKQLRISGGTSSDLKDKTTRGLSDKDKFAIQCILDKVKLPVEAYKCISVDSKDDSGDGAFWMMDALNQCNLHFDTKNISQVKYVKYHRVQCSSPWLRHLRSILSSKPHVLPQVLPQVLHLHVPFTGLQRSPWYPH